MNNTLIVFPKDDSTSFLNPIHDEFDVKTLVRKSTSKKDILTMIADHDRIIAMGHGTPSGLLSVGQFPDSGPFVINQSHVDLLKKKTHNIFIWCYAFEFAKQNSIPCIATNMFISERLEAFFMGLKNVTQSQVEESNDCFVKEISKVVHEPLNEIYSYLMKSEYAKLSQINPVAAYNFERLHLINLN